MQEAIPDRKVGSKKKRRRLDKSSDDLEPQQPCGKRNLHGGDSAVKAQQKRHKPTEAHGAIVVAVEAKDGRMEKKKKKKKKKRIKTNAKDATAQPTAGDPASVPQAFPIAPLPSWPFQPHPADHCETPRVAYGDLAPALHVLASNLYGIPPCKGAGSGGEAGGSFAVLAPAAASASGVNPSHLLKIYDPYFCTGRVKENLASLGFSSVRNVCEDFYEAADQGSIPDFDVLVTNPPVGGNHEVCYNES